MLIASMRPLRPRLTLLSAGFATRAEPARKARWRVARRARGAVCVQRRGGGTRPTGQVRAAERQPTAATPGTAEASLRQRAGCWRDLHSRGMAAGVASYAQTPMRPPELADNTPTAIPKVLSVAGGTTGGYILVLISQNVRPPYNTIALALAPLAATTWTMLLHPYIQAFATDWLRERRTRRYCARSRRTSRRLSVR